MTRLSSFIYPILLIWTSLIWQGVCGQMLGRYIKRDHFRRRQNNNNNGNNGPDKSAFNIVNGRIFTPGLGIILSPQPFTPEGGDFLQVAIDISGDGKLPVAPQNTDDPLTQIFNITLFLTSNTLLKNFTISNVSTITPTPPLANVLIQEPSSTVKHINFEWPDCLVGDGKSAIGSTARGDYNISIHQNFRLNGSNFYSIFNLPISVTNSISQFPGANQLLTNPAPGPLNTNGGRMSCAAISNPLMNFTALVNSVNNPPGQPFQDIQVETTPKNNGGTVGGPGQGGNGQQIGQGANGAQGQLGSKSGSTIIKARSLDVVIVTVISVLGIVMSW